MAARTAGLGRVRRAVDDDSTGGRILLAGSRPEITGRSSVDLSTYTEEILRSGFPGIRDLPGRPRQVQLDGYVARIVERELPENGVAVRRPGALKAWLAAYAAATTTTRG